MATGWVGKRGVRRRRMFGFGYPPTSELRSVAALAASGNAPDPGLINTVGYADRYVGALRTPDAVCAAKGHPDPCGARRSSSLRTTPSATP
jgi:hypothetical protein